MTRARDLANLANGSIGGTLGDTLAAKAPLASPALTGVPTAPTAAAGTNTTQLATTAFVNSLAKVRNVVYATNATQAICNGDYTQTTAVSATITPSSTDSIILIFSSISRVVGSAGSNSPTWLEWLTTDPTVFNGNLGIKHTMTQTTGGNYSYVRGYSTLMNALTPNTTSPITYYYVGASGPDVLTFNSSAPSTMVVVELAP